MFVGHPEQGAEHRDDGDEDGADKQRRDAGREECLGHFGYAPDFDSERLYKIGVEMIG